MSTEIENSHTVIGFRLDKKKEYIAFLLADVKRVIRMRRTDLYKIPRTAEDVLGLYRDDNGTYPVFDLVKVIRDKKLKIKQLDTSTIYIPLLIININGYDIGLALPEEPNFFSGTVSEKKPRSELVGKLLINDDKIEFKVVDIIKLFPNFTVTGNSHTSDASEDDELDMSQYVLPS